MRSPGGSSGADRRCLREPPMLRHLTAALRCEICTVRSVQSLQPSLLCERTNLFSATWRRQARSNASVKWRNRSFPLIMCGGAGTRLWPASRENRPKQFLPLFGPLSTFQETIRRVSDPALFGRPVIVTNAQYRFLVAEQLAAIGARSRHSARTGAAGFRSGDCRGRRLMRCAAATIRSLSRLPPIMS